MNSAIKAILYFVLSVLSLLWFGYEAVNYLSRGNAPSEDNAVMTLTLTGLKLVMAICFFISGINALRKKD
ncbi:hypothetical protein BH10ACI1_BH10ACI1_09330 [soil metagenome]